jgi:nucleoside-diphosphate-sugar epimerase
MESSYLINVLLIGGRGNIGAGLRTYLPRIDDKYDVTSIDLPGSTDKAGDKVPGDLIDLDINEHPEQLAQLMQGRDMVVYLARRSPLAAMNTMTDLVFEALSQQSPMPLVVASSSVHACDGAYSVDEDPWSTWAERRFDDLDPKPQQILSSIDACPNNDYAEEKAYVEQWCKKLGDAGHGAVAARWGGINSTNQMSEERGYFALWCHQEDASRFVHACYTSHSSGDLPPGAHYFVVSNNTYNIFDLDIPRREIGYQPTHNAEIFYDKKRTDD